MKTYGVRLPVAGHVYVEVEAESEEDAIDKAFEESYTVDDLVEWETLRQFNQGNVCYCPHPWEADAELIEEDDEDEPAVKATASESGAASARF